MRKKTLGFQKHNPFTFKFPVHANMILPKSANQSNTSLGVRRSSRKKISVERRAALIALREAGVCIDEIQKQTSASRASIFRLARASKYPKSKNKKAGRPKKTTKKWTILLWTMWNENGSFCLNKFKKGLLKSMV